MRRYFALPAAAGLVAVLLLLLRLGERSPAPPPSPVKRSLGVAPPSFRPTPPTEPRREPGYDPGCLARWRALESLDIGRFGRPHEDAVTVFHVDDPEGLIAAVAALDESGSCDRPPATHHLAEHEGGLRRYCGEAKRLSAAAPRERRATAIIDCWFQLMAYRSAVLNELTPTAELDRVSDPQRLIRLFHAAQNGGRYEGSTFSFDPGRSPSPAELAEAKRLRERSEAIVRRMLEVDPRSPEVATLVLGYRLRETPPGTSHAQPPRLAAAVEQLEKSDPGNRYVPEVRIALAAEAREPTKIREIARAELRRDADSATGRYHLAWATYLEGDRRGARQLLEEGLRLASRGGGSGLDRFAEARIAHSLSLLDEPPPRPPDGSAPDLFFPEFPPPPSFGIALPERFYGEGPERP